MGMGSPLVARHGRFRNGGVSWAAVVVATVALAGCGGGDARTSEAGCTDGRTGDGTCSQPGIVPTKAAIIVTLDLSRGEAGGVARARSVLERIPAWRIIDPQLPTPDDLIGELAESGVVDNTTWRRDVEPWIGDEAGSAAWVNAGERGDGAVGGVAWVDARDLPRAAAAAGRAFGGRVARGDHGDVDVHSGELADGTDIAWATYAGRLVVASDARALEASIDAAGGTSYEDRDEWRRLTRPRASNEDMTIARLVVTRSLFTRDTLDRLTHSVPRARALVRRFGDLFDRDQLDGIAWQFGASGRGLWLDVVTVGALSKSHPNADARRALGRLPIGTVVGVATSRAGVRTSGSQLELLREQVQSVLAIATASGAGSSGSRRMAAAIADALPPLQEDAAVASAREAWGSQGAVGVLIEDALPSLVLAVDVEGATAADATTESWLDAFGTVAGGLVPGLDVDASVDGSGGGTFEVVGIPRSRIARAIAPGAALARQHAIMAHPMFRHVFADPLSGAWRTTDTAEVLAVPAQAIDRIDSSWNEDADTLASDPSFTDAIASARVPDDATFAWWIDTARIVALAADTVGGRAAGVVTTSATALDGPIGWIESRRDGDATVHRLAMELPLQE